MNWREIIQQSIVANATMASVRAIFCWITTLLIYVRTVIESLIRQTGEVTGIFALKQIVNLQIHFFERIIWFLLVIGSCFAVYLMSSTQIKRYIVSPTVMSLDRDYREWNGTMPAITICYHDHMDSYKAHEYIESKWNISVEDDEYFYFLEFLYSVVNATANDYADLARFAEDERFDNVDLYEVVRSIDRPFDQNLMSFDKTVQIQVDSVMTERGLCYAFNSPISEILTNRHVEVKEFRKPLTCQYAKNQCFIKMQIFESAATIDVHSPYEVSASDSSLIEVDITDEIIASYKVMETVASENLRHLTPTQRKCVFADEEVSQLPIYSKTLCLARCRAIMALEMCNCVPFFYPFVDGPSCNPAGFECLMDFKWPIWALHICKCPNTCTYLEYSLHSTKKSFWGGSKVTDEVLKVETEVMSSFRWDLIPPKVRMRRDVLFSFEDLLVSFGGTMSLFLGLSFISIIQIIYVLFENFVVGSYKFLIFLKNSLKVFMSKWKNFSKKTIPTRSGPKVNSIKI